MNIGQAIQTIRINRNMSQNTLGDLSGISGSYISLLERGGRNPPLTTLTAIAAALHIPVTYLVFLAEDPPTEVVPIDIQQQLYFYIFKLSTFDAGDGARVS